MGIVNNINATGTLRGSCLGVGAGTAPLLKVSYAVPAPLIPLLVANFASKGMVGPSAYKLASAISVGTSAILMTGTGPAGVITGPTGPAPSTGLCTCFIM